MDVPAAILALVLAEVAIGGLVILWASPTWGKVRHGYEILLGGTLGLMALGAWGALSGPLATLEGRAGNDASAAAIDAFTYATNAHRGLLAVVVLTALSMAALLARQALLGRIFGIASALAGLATLLPLAQLRATRGQPGGVWQGVLELALGAFFLGAIWDGMILGHWYLVERKLTNRYMVQIAWLNIAATVAGLVAVLLSTRNPAPCAGLSGTDLQLCALTFSPILSIDGFTLLLGVGLVSIIATIAAFNVKLAREGGRSIQASTGMFYLAVIVAPAAEFAAKIRFF